MTLPAVLSICGDAGGAAAVAPVIELLRREAMATVRAVAYRQARGQWKSRGLDFEEIEENVDLPAVQKMLSENDTTVLLAGSSVNPANLERLFIRAACDLRVPSVAVLDFWANYRRRFSDQQGSMAYLPDRIAVMDERARDEMVDEGFEPDRLVITGQPALDGLRDYRRHFTEERRLKVREALGVKQGELLVLFASQPLSEMYGADTTTAGHPGYTEQPIATALLSALEAVARDSAKPLVLAIRPHPRESAENWRSFSGNGVRTLVATEGESRELALAADLVTGMTTVLLVDAAYLGCPTVSIQLGTRVPDPLPTNRLGLSEAAYQDSDLLPMLSSLLLNEEARRPDRTRMAMLNCHDGATRRVASLTCEMMRHNSLLGRPSW